MNAGIIGCCMLAVEALQGAQPIKGVPDLKAFFQQQCVRCHGLDGSAVAADGKRLKGLDFTSPREMEGKTDQELVQTIRKGLFFGLAMPSFKDRLSEAEARILVQEVIRKAEKGKPIQP